MGLKEIGVGGFVVVGGAIYGLSEFGLSDVLTDDLKYVHEIPVEEREAYMTSVVTQFTEFYEGATYSTDDFDFVGDLQYDLNPKRSEFIEVVQSMHDVPQAEVKNLREYYAGQWMCDFEDSLIFTDKGWSYTTKMKNKNGQVMVTVTCQPEKAFGLRS